MVEAKARAIEWLESKGIGNRTVNYRLRDWLVSRQRYWGCPIPVVHCPSCGIVPVPDEELPVLAPDDVEFLPTGKSPLALHDGFLHTTCPKCGEPAERETDTMDTFVDSSWYFLRFCDPFHEDKPFDAAEARHWMPVDHYIGGIEHAILHLLYARFYTRVLVDLGIATGIPREPFARYFAQGMIRMDGTKMSKSKGNLIAPSSYYESVGADALRLFHLFVGPPADDFDWTEQTDQIIDGNARFLDRLWRLASGELAAEHRTRDEARLGDLTPADVEMRRATHRTIAKVSQDIERWSYHTAVAACMELVNVLYGYVRGEEPPHRDVLEEALDGLLRLMAPMTPHITAELWEIRHPDRQPLHSQSWPSFDPDLVRSDTVTMVVQVNGKLRDRLEVDADTDEEAARAAALASPKVAAELGGREPQRVIVRPPKLVNVVV